MELTQSVQPTMLPMTPSTKLSTVDVKSVAGKLEELATGLPDQEQAILGWMLHRAESCSNEDLNAAAAISDDFSGPTRPMAMQLADSVGLGQEIDQDIDVTVEVRWTYRF